MSIFSRIQAAASAWRRGGYDGASDSPHRPSASSRGTTPTDEENQIGSWGRAALVLECRDLRRNNPIVAGVCERFADNVVGPGVMPQAKTDDPKWNEDAEAFFGEWAKIADYRKRGNLRYLQRMVVSEWLVSGELFFALTTGGQLQPIEAERIQTPSGKNEKDGIFDGVKVSTDGIPLGFYVGSRDSSGYVDIKNMEYVRSADIIHCARKMRPDQIRGIPALAPVITSLRDHGMLIHSLLQRAKLESRPSLVVTGPSGAAKMQNLGPRNITSGSTQTRERLERVDDASVYYLNKDENIFSPALTTPNPQFGMLNDAILRFISSALSLPYEFLLLYFTNGTFSSNKAALAQTYKTILGWYTDLCEQFNERTWNWRIAKAIKESDLRPAPLDRRGISEWYLTQWSQPDYSWIDPDAGMDAAIKAWNMGVGSITSFARKQGRDGEDVLREKATDLATAQRIVDEMNKANPGLNLTRQEMIMTLQPGQMPNTVDARPAPTEQK